MSKKGEGDGSGKDKQTVSSNGEVPLPVTQRKKLKAILQNEPPLQVREEFFLIHYGWFTQWKEYVNWAEEESSTEDMLELPPEIDNTPLVDDSSEESADNSKGDQKKNAKKSKEDANASKSTKKNSTRGGSSKKNQDIQLKPMLQENVDFAILPKEAWNLLYGWYKGGPVIKRCVIYSEPKPVIEVYLLKITLKGPSSQVTAHFSKSEFIDTLKAYGVVELQMDVDDSKRGVQIYLVDPDDETQQILLSDGSKRLEQCEIEPNSTILFQAVTPKSGKSNKDTTPNSSKSNSKSSTTSKDKDKEKDIKDKLKKNKNRVNEDSGHGGGAKVLGWLSTVGRGVKSFFELDDENYSDGYYSRSYYMSSSSYSRNDDEEEGFFSRNNNRITGKKYSEPQDDRGGPKSSKSNYEITCGVTGLQNLGNTCFMNSALQCLSNTESLTRFFLNKNYSSMTNKSNPLASPGCNLVLQYGQLIEALWSGKYMYVTPRGVKRIIGKVAPQFADYNQHDSHELLAFLLDGLHEDLNQVKKKPVVETIEGDEKNAGEEIASKAWEGYLRRNKSVIVDMFVGQLKSTVMCPEPKCGKVTVIFDPFMYLSLPMPSETRRFVEVIFVFRSLPNVKIDERVVQWSKGKDEWIKYNPEGRFMRYSILCERSERMSDLKAKLSSLISLSIINSKSNKSNTSASNDENDANNNKEEQKVADNRTTNFSVENMLVTEVIEHRVRQIFADGKLVNAALSGNNKIVVYETPGKLTNKWHRVCIIHRVFRTIKKEEKTKKGTKGGVSEKEDKKEKQRLELMGLPLLIWVSKEHSTGKEMWKLVWERISHLLPDTLRASLETKIKASNQSSSSLSNESDQNQDHSDSKQEENHKDKKSSKKRTKDGDKEKQEENNNNKSDKKSKSDKQDKQQEVKENDLEWPPPYTTADLATADPLFPFKLSFVSQAGILCGANRCLLKDQPKSKSSSSSLAFRDCYGCPIPYDDTAIQFKDPTRTSVISIDWNITPELPPEKMVTNDPSVITNREIRESQKNNVLKLEDCIELFCQREVLGENDKWYCPRCKEHKQATKQFEIWKLPEILVVHLKRFSYKRNYREKIGTYCEFPLKGLNLERFVNTEGKEASSGEGGWVYDLYGVSNHMGGMGGGHYTANCLNKDTGEWYNFNDSDARKMNESAVRTAAAYVLFYKRRGSSSGDGGKTSKENHKEEKKDKEEKKREKEEKKEREREKESDNKGDEKS